MATNGSTSSSSFSSSVQELDVETLDAEVMTAASLNQPVIVAKWLQTLLLEDVDTRTRMVQVLKQAAHCLHVDVIKQFRSPPLSKRLLRKAINTTDSRGMTMLHHTARCCQLHESGRYNQYAMMEVLTYLCEQGGDPTIMSKDEKTPKIITEEDNCQIAAALLEILELIHCKKSKRFPVPQYANINMLHKTILHWAVNSERHQIVSHILLMHQRNKYEVITALLFDSDPNSMESFQEAPIFTAAKIGNPDLLKALIARSGIPLNVVLGQRQKCVIPRPDGSKWERYNTPLSLLLAVPQSYSHIEILVDINKILYDGHPTSIDLSSTGIDTLPVEVFQLQNLSSLNVHNNSLTQLPFSNIPTKFWPRLLKELNLSHNSLEHIPPGLFELACLKTLNLSHNPMQSLPDQWWAANSIVTLDVSSTQLQSLSIDIQDRLESRAASASLPRLHSVIQGQFSLYGKDDIACRVKDINDSLLQTLNASNCNIDQFPHLLALVFPSLEVLNLSGNQLQSVCAINELPTSLTELDLSNNDLRNLKDCRVFHRDTRYAVINSCMRHHDLDKLKTLKLANNVQLKEIFLSEEITVPGYGSTHVFFSKLRRLNLANCGLENAPNHLAELQNLTDLNISNNTDLTIPRGICNLEALVNFSYDGIKDPLVNDLNVFTLTRDKQIYLRQERNVRYPSIKLLFVGNEMINLPLCLSRSSIQSKAISMIVANENTWCISKTTGDDLTIKFNVWNFIDQNNDKPFMASQCFLTENALYVLCWQITNNKDHGISKLRSWLLKIYDRAKSAPIIIVGCHSSGVNDRMRRNLVNDVQNYCKKKLPFYLEIVSVNFVTVTKLEEDIVQLCKCLYDTACDHKMSLGSKFLSQKLINIKISKNYFQFLGLISKKVLCIEKQKDEGPPILKWSDLASMAGLDKEDNRYSLFKDDKELTVAVKYMIENGTIMHFDNPGLSDYYFIDPHWLYYVFCRVCMSSSLTCSSKIDTDDGKVNRSQIQQIFNHCGIPINYSKLMFKLLCRFEIAIPLDAETLLLPSALNSDPRNKLYSSVNCKFPGDEVPDLSVQKRASYGSILSVAASTESLFKSLNIFFTGMCYRRLFLAPHVPGNFWWKLIPRFISSASSFYQIIINNCVKGMTVGKMANVGDAVICNNHCKWLYWSNGITLTFGDNVLLCINGLMRSDDTNNRIPLSVTVDRIKTMKFFNGSQWEQQFYTDIDGFEVNVPEYILQSSVEETGQTNFSCKLGCQILSHILEILNELCTELFKGHPEKGIYSGSHFSQLVPCPHCYGDKSPLDGRVSPVDEDSNSITNESLHFLFSQSIKPIDFTKDAVVPENNCYGYNIQSCILEAQKNGILSCPNHGKLRLIYLTPDLMFEDITSLTKVSAKEVEDKKQQLGKGAFGAVYKVKLNSNPHRFVALKCFTNLIIKGKLREHTLQDLAGMYADMRLEVNKLATIDHPNIIKFLGLCVVSFSFLLEWAPKGTLEHMIREYKLAGFPICPDAIANTVLQVSSALAYLHSEKKIVHFDIKPDNVLVFKYPQPGHHCFSMEMSSLICDSCYGEGGGVLLKLADLGVSAFVGPGGFHRSNTTPTYSAPEVLKYSGKEPLTEKVDIFALGISLYEVMTLRKLPPEGAYLDFNFDIAAGRRPEFVPEDPNYPLALVECVRSCWAHQYTQRPTAKRIEKTFKQSNILKLHNSYEMKNKVITAALVTMAQNDTEIKETIWIATAGIDGPYNLTTYIFVDQEYPLSHQAVRLNKQPHPKLCVSNQPIQLFSRVKEMCHHGQHIWILYTSGYLAVFDMDSQKIIQNIELQELSNDPVTIVVVDHATGLIATAYTNGLIAYMWDETIPFDDNISIAYFRSTNTITVSYQDLKLTTVEWCSDVDGHCQIWCGYSIGVIQIVGPPMRAYGDTEVLKILQIDKYCTEIPHGTSIVQLKFSVSISNDDSSIMYALHGKGACITCWVVSEEPKLCATINLSQISSASTLLPVNHALYVGDKTGRIRIIDTHQITEGKYSDELLAGGHHAKKVDFLVAIKGRLNAHGLLSSVGMSAVANDDGQTSPQSMYYVKRLDSVPCTLLMSIGIGYHEVFTEHDNDNTYFITWTFPCYI